MKKILLVLLVLGLIAGSIASRKVLDPLHEREMLMDMAYLPNGKMLGWISGGMNDVLSDVLWLRSMRYVMDHFSSDRDYTYLYRVYDIITDLDPNFVKAYRFGGYFLTGVTDERGYAAKAVDLLEKGWKNNPESWVIAYELGSIYHISLKDRISAAEWFSKASAHPDCPAMIREYATTIFEEEGRLEQALKMWRRILNGAGEGSLKEIADWNVKRVESQILLERLRPMIEKYRDLKGGFPESLDDLRTCGMIPFIPRDAFDEELIYAPSPLGRGQGEFTLCSRELIRRALSRRITYLHRLIREFKHKQGEFPSTIAGIAEDPDALWRSLPLGIQLDYDPEKGELSYDKTFAKYGL